MKNVNLSLSFAIAALAMANHCAALPNCVTGCHDQWTGYIWTNPSGNRCHVYYPMQCIDDAGYAASAAIATTCVAKTPLVEVTVYSCELASCSDNCQNCPPGKICEQAGIGGVMGCYPLTKQNQKECLPL